MTECKVFDKLRLTMSAKKKALAKNTFDDPAFEHLKFVADLPLTIMVVFAEKQMNVRDYLELSEGSVIELDKMAGEPLDLQMNGKPLAKGEVVISNEKFSLRLTEIIKKR